MMNGRHRSSSDDEFGNTSTPIGRHAFTSSRNLEENNTNRSRGNTATPIRPAGGQTTPNHLIASSPFNESDTISNYGGTPRFVREIRKARADIGDLGRSHLMDDFDRYRITDNLQSDVIFDIQNSFTSFFDTFIIADYPKLTVTDEDLEIIDLMHDPGEDKKLGHYGWKMVHYIENPHTVEEVHLNETPTIPKAFEVNLLHIQAFQPHLHNLIIQHPADSVCEIDMILRHKYFEVLRLMEEGVSTSVDASMYESPKVRFYNKPKKDSPRRMDPSMIDTLVAINGIVIRSSELLPEISMAAFRCTGRKRVGVESFVGCEHEVYVQVIEGEVMEPQHCVECKGRKTFELWHNMCHFSSKQFVKVSELAEHIPPGEVPQSIAVYAYDDLIDCAQPGDRVEVVGIFKASGVRLNPRLRNLNAVFRTYVDALHIRKDARHRIRTSDFESHGKGIVKRAKDGTYTGDIESPMDFAISKDVIAKLNTLARDPKIYQKLIDSLAPTIYGREDVKKGLLCQMFGGSKIANKKYGHFRNELHILLCGDPSTAKSQLLQYVHKLSPRGVFASGKGSSGAGLTAAVSRDPDTKEFILESGAVVLSDRGICCIDEFDKMDESARAVLHEVMEQQTVTIAKAGIVATLNARTAVLASANPIHSRYDRRKAVVENINLPPSLFSRFDLIYLVLDTPDEQEDRMLAKVLAAAFTANPEASAQSHIKERPIPAALLAQYISYARATCHPRLSAGASALLQEEYCKMRYQEGGSKTPTASPRQLEALIRISQALAKMRLADFVSEEDSIEAVRLMKVATYQSLIDPSTGKIDFDQVHLGQTIRERAILEKIKAAAKQVFNEGPLQKDALYSKLQIFLNMGKENGDVNGILKFDYKQLDDVLAAMERDEIISRNQNGEYNLLITTE